MINGNITVKGSNGMIKALIVSSLVMGLLMGFTFMTLAYGVQFQMTDDRFDRLVSINGMMWVFKCPYDDKTFSIDMGSYMMSEEYFIKYEGISGCEKTPQQILDESSAMFSQYVDNLKSENNNSDNNESDNKYNKDGESYEDDSSIEDNKAIETGNIITEPQ